MNKKMKLNMTPMSEYCEQYLRSQTDMTEKEKQQCRKTWDMAVAKFISLMGETSEAGMSEIEAHNLLHKYKDEVLTRVLGNKYGNLG